jgi:arginyl-tRNA synthetase
VAIRGLREKVERLKKSPGNENELRKAQEELDDWVAAAADLRARNQAVFDRLMERINVDPNPEASIAAIVQGYEQAESGSKELVREIVDLCLSGFNETYRRVGISWDSWDWESDMVWSGRVAKALAQLRRTGYVRDEKGAVVLDAERAAVDLRLKSVFGIQEGHEIPPLTLIRSDGTTLYTTRDIAYSFWKFERAERVVNVIGSEQSLAQLQLRVAVAALSSASKAANLVHYAYEMVELPGYKMSRRRGRFVSFDEILDESIRRAYDEVTKRSPQLPEELKRSIASSVGLGAVKYAMLSVAPIKTVSFTWDRVLNFEMNSAPFTQYAHARACNILAKAEGLGDKPDFSLLKEPLEWDLVLKVARFPDVFLDAAESLKPSAIAEYANDLASSFNSFYASLRVLRAETPPLRDARLRLVDAVRLALRNSLEMMGIDPVERM